MQNRKQIAERLGITPNRLGNVLSTLKFEPTNIEVVGSNAVHLYDDEAVAKIEAIFKAEPKP